MKNFKYLITVIIGVCVTISCNDDNENLFIPTACFEISTVEATIGDTISFINCSEDANAYIWNFGDGNNSFEENPINIYKNVGEFTISLIAINKEKTDTALRTIEIYSPWGLIPDGGFELSNSLDYWNDTLFTNGSINIDNNVMLVGNASLYINIEQAYWIELDHHDIEIENNTTYEFSIWYKYNGYKYSPDYPIMLGFYNEDNNFLWTAGSSIGNEYTGYTGNGIDVDWTQLTGTFNSSDYKTAKLFINSCMENTWIDEITFKKID
ncbi:MAG: hypothetical protein KOO66_12570 [Bacteroidales bacterium]|nr:hypothetical protein [Bacteroidales bacterium]